MWSNACQPDLFARKRSDKFDLHQCRDWVAPQRSKKQSEPKTLQEVILKEKRMLQQRKENRLAELRLTTSPHDGNANVCVCARVFSLSLSQSNPSHPFMHPPVRICSYAFDPSINALPNRFRRDYYMCI